MSVELGGHTGSLAPILLGTVVRIYHCLRSRCLWMVETLLAVNVTHPI
jgi:hypothetical protein